MAQALMKPGVAVSPFDTKLTSDDATVIEPITDDKPSRDATKRRRAKTSAPASKFDTLPLAQSSVVTIDLADPAQVAILMARYNALNDSLQRMAEDKASTEKRHAAELKSVTDSLRAVQDELQNAELDIEDKALALEHAQEKLDLILKSDIFSLRKLAGKAMTAFVVAFACLAAFAVIFM